jgi:hypothetical protein
VLGQACANVYNVSNLGKTYHVICGVQTFLAGGSANDSRLQSTQYLAQAAAPQSPYVKSAAKNWTSHIAPATYWAASEYGDPQEAIDSAAYQVAPANIQTQIANRYADTCNSGSGAFTVFALAATYSSWKSWAQANGVNRMCAYEGCYSNDYTGGGASNDDKLRWTSKSSPNLYGYLLAVYYNFTKLSDATFIAEFPSNFIIGDFTDGSGSPPTTYAWSVFVNDIWSSSTPQWDAIVAYNGPKRATNLRMRIHG